MRDTVDKILNVEATRLFEKSRDKGLAGSDLQFLNALIATYKNFIGEPPGEQAPEQQSVDQLLASIAKQVPEKPVPDESNEAPA